MWPLCSFILTHFFLLKPAWEKSFLQDMETKNKCSHTLRKLIKANQNLFEFLVWVSFGRYHVEHKSNVVPVYECLRRQALQLSRQDIWKALLGQKAEQFLIFWGISILLSTLIVPVCIPTNSAEGFPFLHILTSTWCLLTFWWKLFWQVWDGNSLWFKFA